MIIEILFLILLLLSAIVTFVQYKKEILFKRIFKSFFNTVYLCGFSLLFSIVISLLFRVFSYELQNGYQNIEMAKILYILEIVVQFIIPLIYILLCLKNTYIKTAKK